ncbi:helix-turn-helix domain-containing protein [Streptomyces lydicus]|uniref:AraC family transcriptional regulator n=1 Tax=Streptomyces lydicus TaxID=47763 RepID=A0A1D7VN04_9ACTN|nr:helix-turn-helix domain-containing protein [Streptomyces lydicus]AOP47898.1 AraC family transcriptional regulator [Streptomyces lydicus]
MLNETVFRSEDVSEPERLACWAERLGQTHAPVRLESDHAHDFRAYQRVLDLGAVSLWPATFQQSVIRRTPRLIRRSDPEHYHLSLVVRGTGAVTWDDHEAVYRPSDLHLNDSSMPWEIRTGESPVTTLGIEIPKHMVPLPRDLAGRKIPRRLPSGKGIGALLAQFLIGLCADTTAYQPSDGPRLGRTLTDLVTALLAHAHEASNALPADTHRRTLLLRIKQFITEQLHEPRLTPTAVANAHHISVSYLHRLFQDEDATVAAWIRLRRLNAACRDLADPALGSTPIRAIAARWGFPHAADFTRAFRTAYGLPPSAYRRQHLEPAPEHRQAARGPDDIPCAAREKKG